MRPRPPCARTRASAGSASRVTRSSGARGTAHHPGLHRFAGGEEGLAQLARRDLVAERDAPDRDRQDEVEVAAADQANGPEVLGDALGGEVVDEVGEVE